MAHFQRQHDAPVAALSDEQFDELKQLLAPGHELATLMLADYKAQREARLAVPSEDKTPTAPDQGSQQT